MMSKVPAEESVAIIIPALDEEAVIGRVVESIRGVLDPGAIVRIIVVDNGSADRTAAVAAAAGAEVVSEPTRGYGQACAAGVAAADGSEILVLLDGDGSDDPADLAAILGPLRSGEADLVVGVRARSERGAMTVQQIFGNRLACLAIHLIHGTRINDLGPFRAIRRRHLLLLEMDEMTYGWSTEMVVKSLRARLRYREVEVSYRRRTGVSKVGGSVLGSLRAGRSILGTVARHSRWVPASQARPIVDG